MKQKKKKVAVTVVSHPQLFAAFRSIALDSGGPLLETYWVSTTASKAAKAEDQLRKLSDKELRTFATGCYHDQQALLKKYGLALVNDFLDGFFEELCP